MTRPVFIVSDLHMGDGGLRDNFAHMSGGNREAEFWAFLEYMEGQNGKLVINGDLFELWQGNMSKVLTHRIDLLDRLADLESLYLLGNHDIDLSYFRYELGIRLTHQLFHTMGQTLSLEVAHQNILILHGHQCDQWCKDENPGVGRASAIYTGIKEDKNGGPLLEGKFGTVEANTLGRIGRLARLRRLLRNEPSPTQVIRNSVVDQLKTSKHDVLIFGHTHEPGQFVRFAPVVHYDVSLPIYNCGSWTEKICSFVRIEPEGQIGVYNWVDGKPVRNHTKLLVER